jgi:hypothetical protein
MSRFDLTYFAGKVGKESQAAGRCTRFPRTKSIIDAKQSVLDRNLLRETSMGAIQ